MTMKMLVVELGLSASNEEILDQMRVLRNAREENFVGYVVCAIRGFEDDRRELYDIPEVRAFCRRIVNLGLVTYLDPSPQLEENFPYVAMNVWGAIEIWLCSEGRLKAESLLTVELLDEIDEALVEANAKADAILGPIT